MSTPFLKRLGIAGPGVEGSPAAGVISVRRRSRFEPAGPESPRVGTGLLIEERTAERTEPTGPALDNPPVSTERPAPAADREIETSAVRRTDRGGPTPAGVAQKSGKTAERSRALAYQILEQDTQGQAAEPSPDASPTVDERTSHGGQRTPARTRSPTAPRSSSSAPPDLAQPAAVPSAAPPQPTLRGRHGQQAPEPRSADASESAVKAGKVPDPRKAAATGRAARPITDAQREPSRAPTSARPELPPLAPRSPRADALAPIFAQAAALTPHRSAPPPDTDGPNRSEDTVVNVTIGRLEVRAQAAVPDRPAQSRAPRRRPSSLDQYLRSRSLGQRG